MRQKTRGVVIVPILIGLAVAAVVWVASYRGGGPKLADTGGSPSALAATPITASGSGGSGGSSASSDVPAAKTAEVAKY